MIINDNTPKAIIKLSITFSSILLVTVLISQLVALHAHGVNQLASIVKSGFVISPAAFTQL
jgi:hypothetical protein